MIEFLNNLAESWAWVFGVALVQNTIFLTILLFILFLLRNSSARLRHNVGLIGIVKLLIPPLLPVSILSTLFSRETVDSVTLIFLAPTIAVNPAEKTPAGLTVSAALFVIWVVVAVTFIIRAISSTIRLRKGLMSSTPLGLYPDDTLFRKPAVEILATDAIALPLTFGFRQKRIFVPKSWYLDSKESRRVILAHEYAHIRRGDGLVKAMQIITIAVYFFHPLVWILNKRLEQYGEMACDDEAIKSANCHPTKYSGYLVQMAERLVRQEPHFSSVSALIRQKNELMKRVNYQMKENVMKNISKSKQVLVITALALLFFSFSWYCSKDKPAEQFTAPPTSTHAASVGEEFVAYDTPPKPVGGFAAIQKNLRYPEIARKAGIEGTVMVKMLVDESGEVVVTEIAESLGDNGCDEAAVEALKSVKWKPAMQKDKPVKVWVSIPVNFRLSGGEAAPKEADFVAYDTPPQPVGGFAAVQKNLIYPDISRKAGVEGIVYVKVQVDENGNVVETEIIKSLGDNGCDEAAVAALKSVKWKPAMQRDKPVKVWVSIPVKFRLSN